MTVASTAAHTIWFADPEGVDINLVGGKGANLGRMTQKGFVVPPGFVVSTSAYMAHIDTLKSQIPACSRESITPMPMRSIPR